MTTLTPSTHISQRRKNVSCHFERAGPVNSDDDCVRLAPRPAIEKITFAHHPATPSGDFMACTNQFADACRWDVAT